jgi:cobalt-precorrin 5A hydrolase
MNKLAVWVLSGRGRTLGKRLVSRFSGAALFSFGEPSAQSADFPEIPFVSLKQAVAGAFHEYDAHLFIMATGIAVRMTGPLLVDKRTDPAVVVMDEKTRHVISLVSGHLGGANDLAEEIALITGAEPVITTATDLSGQMAFDTLARRMNARVEPKAAIKGTSTALLAGKPVALICDNRLYDRIRKNFPTVEHFEAEDIKALDRFEAACIISDTIPPVPEALKNRILSCGR